MIQKLTRSQTNMLVAGVAAVAVLVVLLSLILLRAATPTALLEAEAGQVVGPAKSIDDSTASGGKALQFIASVTPAPTPTPTPPPPSGSWWKPTPGTVMQWQLSGTIKTEPVVYDASGQTVRTGVKADVIGVDLYDTTAQQVTAMHALGKKVVCYMETGFVEPRSPEYQQLIDAGVTGKSLGGSFAEEKYLDIRRTDILIPVMQKRLDLCKQKGFDAVEPDGDAVYFDAGGSIDNATHSGTGFPLSYQDLIKYDRMFADEAHKRGLAVALKNGSTADSPQFAKDMVAYTDFSIDEECGPQGSCGYLKPFTDAQKPVYSFHYSDGEDSKTTPTQCNNYAKSFPLYSFVLKTEPLNTTDVRLCK